MARCRSFVISFVLLLTSYPVLAQLTISAEIRPRAEFRYGFKTLRGEGDQPAFFIEQRTRLNANFQNENIEAYISFQDVRIWGNTDQIYKTDPSLTNLFQGWVKYNFFENWSFKLGRQTLDYDNARFLGDLSWAQQSRSHDALLFIFDNKTGSQLHVGGAYNQSVNEPTQLFGTTYIGLNNYKTMQFAWFQKKGNSGSLSLLFHNDGRQVAADTSMAYRQTYAAIGNYQVNNLSLEGEFYYQGGKNETAQNVSAFLASLTATFKTGLTPLSLGFDYVSGTSLMDSKDKSFNPLYGTNHKFYGYMDYFYVGNFHGQVAGDPSGLLDIYLKANFNLSGKSKLLAHVHQFYSGAKLYNSSVEEVSKNLGTEIDLVYTLDIASNTMLNVGYSILFANESMEVVKGRGDYKLGQYWAWVMFTYKPVIFSTKNE